MKKLSGLIIFLFCALYAFPQYPNNQNVSNNQTRYHIPVLKTDSSIILPIKDTLNNQSTFYPGALTVRPQDTIGHAIFPIYQSNGVYWSKISSIFNTSVGVDSITLYNGLLCEHRGDTLTCWFLTPSTGGDVDSFHLNHDSLYILQYRNGALIDSIFLLHTYLYVDSTHFSLTPNFGGNPYAQLLNATGLVDSIYPSPFGNSFTYFRYGNGIIDSFPSGGGISPSVTPNFAVLDSLSTPAVLPREGSIYLVGTSPTGQFATHANQIATRDSVAGTYSFQTPTVGDLLYNAATTIVSQWTGTAWIWVGSLNLHQGGDSYPTDIVAGSKGAYNLKFITNNVEKGRFNFNPQQFQVGLLANPLNAYTYLDSNRVGFSKATVYDSYMQGVTGGIIDFYGLSALNARVSPNTVSAINGNFTNINSGQWLTNYEPLSLQGGNYGGVGTNMSSIILKSEFTNNTTRAIIYDNGNGGTNSPIGPPISLLPTDGNLLIGATEGSDIKTAKLNLVSTSKGAIISKMNTAQMVAISTGVYTGTTVGGTGYTNGTYNGVALTGGSGTGATANITVVGTTVQNTVVIIAQGTGFVVGDVLSSAGLGGGSGFTFTITAITGSVSNGLMVYNTDSLCYCSFNGTAWVKMCGGSGGTTPNMQQVFDVAPGASPTINAHGNYFNLDSSNFLLNSYSGTDFVTIEANPSFFNVVNTQANALLAYGQFPGVLVSNHYTETDAEITDGGVFYQHQVRTYPDYALIRGIRNDGGITSHGRLAIDAVEEMVTTPTWMAVFNGDTINKYPFSGGGGGGSSLANFYLKDSSLSSNRTVDLNANSLAFQEGGNSLLSLNSAGTTVIKSFDPTAGDNEAKASFYSDGADANFIFGASYNAEATNAFITGQANTDSATLIYNADRHTFNGTMIYHTPPSGLSTDSILTYSPTTGYINQISQTSLNGSDWHITGNSGTDSSVNFLGTTDARQLVLRTNNTSRMFISNVGGVVIDRSGTTTSTNANFELVATSSTNGARITGYGINPNLSFYRSNGTLASPSALALNDNIANLRIAGYGATALGTSKSFLSVLAGAAWTDTNQPTYLTLSTTGWGGTASTERLRIQRTGNFSIGTVTDDTSALVNLVSTVKGFGLPAMTGAQMTAIPSPRSGLMVWNTDSLAACYYNGTVWLKVAYNAAVPSGTYLPLAGGTMVGNIVATDNTYDLGASGATRFRTAYLGTSLVSPLIIGGSGTTQTLTYKTTSGVGATGARHIFQVGNNGATEALTILNNGRVGIGTPTPSALLNLSGGSVQIDNTGISTLMGFNTTSPSGNNGQLISFAANGTGIWQFGYLYSTYSATPDQFGNGSDFRIMDSDNGQVAMVLRPATQSVGISTGSPAGQLHVKVRSTSRIGLVLENTGVPAVDLLQIRTNGASTGNILTVNSVGSLGINNATPAASSILDVTSTTKGVLLPRMNTTQQNAISSPATGLLIFNTDTASVMQYSAGAWQNLHGLGTPSNALTRQSITSGTSATVTGSNYVVTLNLGSLAATYTLTLPASPTDLQTVEIEAGGTITSGNVVVTSLTISPNSGQTLVQAATPTTLNSGEYIKYRYSSSNTSWYREN